MRRWLRLAAVACGLASLSAGAQETRPELLDVPKAPATGTAPTVTEVPAPSGDLAAFVDGYMRSTVDHLGLPSASIVMVRDGRVVLAKSYGYADFEKRRPASVDDTLYRQASISKLFTWLLVMQLVEQGRLDLDRDVNAYLDFRIPDAFGKPITLRHLMTHTAGFDERLRGVFDPGKPRPLGEILRSNIPARVAAPGSTVAYSNYGAALGAYIAERQMGRPFETLVEERILRPLGMTRSTFRQPLPAPLAASLATGYRAGSRAPLDFDWVAMSAAGGMSATPANMGRFLTMLLNRGSLDGVQIVRPETLDRMMRLTQPVGAGLSGGYGLGFVVGEHWGVRHAGHGGNLDGTATYLATLPGRGIGWYVAFNGQGTNGAANRVRRDLLLRMTEYFGTKPAPATTLPAAQSTAGDAAGLYLLARRPHGGFLRVGDALDQVRIAPDKGGAITVSTSRSSDGAPRRWLPVARDRFADEETGEPLVLRRNADGKVVGFASDFILPIVEFQRVPDWLGVARTLLTGALFIVALAAASVPAGWALRRGFARPARRPDGLARHTLWLARLGAWIAVGVIVYWSQYLGRAQQEVTLLTPNADGALQMLRALSVVAAIGLAAMVVDALLAWRDPTRGWPRRLGATIAALAALVLIWGIIEFELISFALDY